MDCRQYRGRGWIDAREVMTSLDYVLLWPVNAFGRVLRWLDRTIVTPVEDIFADKYYAEYLYHDGDKIIMIVPSAYDDEDSE